MNNTVCTNESLYSTLPMRALTATSIRYNDEEAIYIAFEQTTSARFTALQHYLVRNSGVDVATQQPSYPHQDIQSTDASTEHLSVQVINTRWITIKRRLLLMGFGLMCLFAGIDVMGLLMLHLR